MKIQIDLSSEHKETFITIHASQWSNELDALMKKLKNSSAKRLIGVAEEQSIVLSPADIDFVYSHQRKVYAQIAHEQFELKMKLFEVESLLEGYDFTRFSKSVVGNINQIARFELSFNGNLCVYFKSGNKEYVSRGYVSKLKQLLQTGGTEYDR
ncbi:LytTR family DNA-binding domain-containing protein [Metabacillus iocasae]|uniref:DNA-binding LytR/AlgR family response regulator n=1 Tax=Priestia iocasae TaxID=2291674 RepID=A0ABS2QSL7_9BACI|nr:LytTR family DNA-binding domain-containing protein [Metabacillus iocasae]MBM7702460.1 DNA-binding LytR/AlgR family response regulator [Metabacillus iocasae]